jgi:SAM-dependent methyltransferase
MRASAWSDVDRSAERDRLVAGLDRLRAEPFFVQQKAALLDALAVRGGERAVDLGCGTGDDTVELLRAGCAATGLERSLTMLEEARRRHPGLPLVAGDATRLPLPAGSQDRVRVDRVVQHLQDAREAVREWRRVLRPDGRLVVFEPDLSTVRIEGVDAGAAGDVAAWRTSTRPGAEVVRSLGRVLADSGFADVRVDVSVLHLTDLGRADGIMGIADWGELGADAGALDAGAGARWRAEVQAAAADGTLRYTCAYLLATGRVG